MWNEVITKQDLPNKRNSHVAYIYGKNMYVFFGQFTGTKYSDIVS